ncbi:28626_t:CDS:1 [Gigaspora margarita]|uniref:28626_t:CDS:1 n=1 Tax=Gigaspora margarita TaxID=4874 RepID=A0ABM8VXN0_GIGMA|nr:28626_t:CDS:1 [Gigaspora margarita]
MDNVVGQKNIRNNVAEEEVILYKNEQKNAGERNEVVTKGEDTIFDNKNSSTATQKDVAVGDQSSTTVVSATVASIPIYISSSPKNSIETLQSSPTSTSYPYKSNNLVFNKHEILVTSDSQNHFHYLDTDIDPNNLSELDETGLIGLQVVEKNPSPSETLTSTINTTKIITPKRIIRIERDYSRGEFCQFRTTFPTEIDGRVIFLFYNDNNQIWITCR